MTELYAVDDSKFNGLATQPDTVGEMRFDMSQSAGNASKNNDAQV